jgi:outer membrane protein TolC
VASALDRNDDIAIAASRVEDARAQFRLADAQLLPSFALVAGGGAQRAANAFGIDTDQRLGQAQGQVSFDTDLFARLHAASKAARATMLSRAATRDNVRLAVAASAASGYLTLRALDSRYEVLRDTLAARAESLKLARRRAEAGYSPRLDLAQAEADYRSTEQLIPVVELAIRRQEDGLSVLIGENPGPIGRGPALARIAVPTVGPSLSATLMRRRPDIERRCEPRVASPDVPLVFASRNLRPP